MDETPEPAEKERDVLGVDYGLKRIGVALGNVDSGLVLPLQTLAHPGDEASVVELLADVARTRAVGRILLGDPLNMSGTKSPMSKSVRRLKAGLETALEGVVVELVDERLTSTDAEQRLRAAGVRWWQVDKGQVDAMAAMSITRDYLVRVNPRLLLEREPPPPLPSDAGGQSKRDRRKNMRRRKGRDR
ncbi:Holliday junction resolvase RuvX [Planctomycetota bacterium]|nr:Holliday junction resolvase RuvX [Planctomycetota bacterium]